MRAQEVYIYTYFFYFAYKIAYFKEMFRQYLWKLLCFENIYLIFPDLCMSISIKITESKHVFNATNYVF